MSVSHAVYGLRLAANIAIPGLALETDPAPADVRIRLKEPLAFPDIPSESPTFLYMSPANSPTERPNMRMAMDSHSEWFAFYYRDGVRFAVRRDGQEVCADWQEDYTLADACTYLLGPIMGFVLRLRGITCLHASSVALGEHAIALTGLPGAGKSTLAAAFARNGCPVLSDDVVALVDHEGQFWVQPGYPRVNLWPDSVQTLFGSQDALPRITPTWDKRYMALREGDCRFAKASLPLGAIYILGIRDPTLRVPVIEEAAGSEALMALVANTYVSYLLDREMRRREFDLLGRLAAAVPIRFIRPPADASALASLQDAIMADATRSIRAEQPIMSAHCH